MNELEKFAYLQGHNNKMKLRIRRKISECALCKRVKELSDFGYNLCSTCKQWVRTWIVSKYGGYYKDKIREAMNAYFEPIKCKGCGIDLIIKPGVSRLQFRKISLCKKCKNIYKTIKTEYSNIHKPRSGRYSFKR